MPNSSGDVSAPVKDEHGVTTSGVLAAPATNPKDYLWVPAATAYWIGFCIPTYFAALRLLQGNLNNLVVIFTACDAWFLAGVLLFLWLGARYAHQRYPAGIAPYKGAFLGTHHSSTKCSGSSNTSSRGSPAAATASVQQLPRAYPWAFVPFYLTFAFVASYMVPTVGLLAAWAYSKHSHSSHSSHSGSSNSGTVALATLVGYLGVFIPQTLLETQQRWRSVFTPMVPIAFVPYRLWQLARGLWALVLSAPHGQALALTGPAGVLLWALCFWVFDSAVVMLYMPWTFNIQLIASPGAAAAKGD